MKSKIWLSLAKMSGSEQEFIQSAFDTNWVVPFGSNVDGFEQDLKNYLDLGKKQVVALSSGTAALHLALVALGINPNDEVICQSFTFAASANPIRYVGATPVFVDSEPMTWNMSPKALEEAIIDRKKKTWTYPKAIIVVHLYGMPANMGDIMEIASSYGIPVIEDAAEALGSEYKGGKCGTFGLYGVLSFNGDKIITTSEGGALVCPSEDAAERVRFFSAQAFDNAPYYEHTHIGYNYRMSNICAGIGRGQMTALKSFLARRRKIHELYTMGLPELTIQSDPGLDFNSNYWLTCILLNNKQRDELRTKMEKAGIECRPLWKPMHLQPVFAGVPFYGDGTSEKLFGKGLCLPSGASLSDRDVERVINNIRCFL